MKISEFACPVAFTNRVIGGKWKPRIIWAIIRNDVLRFSELRKSCPPISDRILTKELRELEELGFISRTEIPGAVKKTEYRLTELGITLAPVMKSMADWGLKHNKLVGQSVASNE